MFINSQLWLISHLRSTEALLDRGTPKVSPKLEGQKIRSCREVNTGQSVFLFFQKAVVTRRRTGIIMIAESSKRVEKRIR